MQSAPITRQLKAVAFDVDAAALMGIQQALPGWDIEQLNGATAATLSRGWDPEAADLLIVMARQDVTETIGLCRFLARWSVFSTDPRQGVAGTGELHQRPSNEAQRRDAPLIVLVGPEQEPLVRAALEAGAQGCLVLPVHAKEWARTLARAWQGNLPGRHTLALDRAQRKDLWRDDGGQG